MGNVSSLARASSALDSYVAELGSDISYEKSLSSSRFLKTILVRHAYGLLVLKLFIKPDPTMSLRLIQRRLKNQRDALSSIPNTLSYATFVETEKAGYLIRQWAGASLYDRISTRPYLTELEKRWIAFQVLTAMRDARGREVSHGDIKSENILIDPSLNVHITDFASSFKPTFLPLNDPSDFSYFYDSSGRRTCYIAPERFYTDDSKIAAEKRHIQAQANTHTDLSGMSGSASWIGNGIGKRDGKVTEEMDMFSIGCSLLEMWTDGASVFTLSELYSYRDGQLGAVENLLASLEDESVKEMLASMLALNPQDRPTCEKVLVDYRNTIFPDYFYTFLQDYVNDMQYKPESGGNGKAAQNPTVRFASKADEIVEAIADDWSGIIRAVLQEHQLSTGQTDEGEADVKVIDNTGPAILLLNILTANMRNCLRASSRIRSLEPLLPIADLILDEEVIDRILPYVVALLKDEMPQVRAAALVTLVQLLGKVEVITAGNAGLVSEYILPNLRHLAEDEDIHVRSTFAQLVPRLSEIGMHVLEMAQSMNWSETIIPSYFDLDQNHEPDYDVSLDELLETLADQAGTVLVDAKSEVRRAGLAHITQLCLVFGRTKTNDVLLIRMITYLNDQDWRLRCTFLESIVSVAAFVGATSLEEFVLPLMEQALADPEDYVVSRVLISLSSLIELGLFEKARILELLQRVYGFLCHPSAWIRQATASFVAISSHHLEASDTWCILYPYIRPLLKADVPNVEASALLDVVSEPLSNSVLEVARQWYIANPKSPFWSSAVLPAQSGNRSRAFRPMTVADMALPAANNDVDRRYIQLLRQRGLESESDVKLSALKTYLAVQAVITRDRKGLDHKQIEQSSIVAGRSLSLQEMQVTPLTVFITEKPMSGHAEAHSLRKNARSKIPGSDSRRPSFASRPDRQRMMSQDSSASDAEQVIELRRRLVALDALRMSQQDISSIITPVNSTGPATPRPKAPHRTESVTSVPSTSVQDKSTSGRTARSKGSLGADATKAAPAVASSPAIATGQLEIAAHMRLVGLESRASEPGSPNMEPKRDGLDMGLSDGKPYGTTYEGRDPGILSLLESAWQENTAPIDEAFQHVTTPGPTGKRRTPRSSSTRLNRESNREVTLIAHFTEHESTIAGIVVSPDQSYFSVIDIAGKISTWEANRLERSVTSKPRLRLDLEISGTVTFVCAIPLTHCFAVATTDGSIEIVRIQVATSASSLKPLRLIPYRSYSLASSEGYVASMAHMTADGRPCLLMASSCGLLRVIDLTTLETKQTLQQSPEFGRVTALLMDSKYNWAVTGTKDGKLTLWDLRYGIVARRWQCPGRVILIQSHPANPNKWIMVSCEVQPGHAGGETLQTKPLLHVYDIATSHLVQMIVVTSSDNTTVTSPQDPTPDATQNIPEERNPAERISEILRRTETRRDAETEPDPFNHDEAVKEEDITSQAILATHSIPGSRSHPGAIVSGLSPVKEASKHLQPTGNDHARPQTSKQSNLLITAGEDRIVRLWNLSDVSSSMVISGSGKDADKVYRTIEGKASSRVIQLIVEQPVYPEPSLPHNHYSKLAKAVIQEREDSQVSAQQARQLLRPHLTAVTVVVTLETPFSNALIVVTGDRSGIVKVWRIGLEPS